eukprot:UN11322
MEPKSLAIFPYFHGQHVISIPNHHSFCHELAFQMKRQNLSSIDTLPIHLFLAHLPPFHCNTVILSLLY